MGSKVIRIAPLKSFFDIVSLVVSFLKKLSSSGSNYVT